MIPRARFRGVCSVIELSEKKGDKYILAAPPCAVPTVWGLTKLKLLIAVGVILTALFPAAVSLRCGSPSPGWVVISHLQRAEHRL